METQAEGLRTGSARDAVPRKRPRVSGARASALSTHEARQREVRSIFPSQARFVETRNSLTTRHSDSVL